MRLSSGPSAQQHRTPRSACDAPPWAKALAGTGAPGAADDDGLDITLTTGPHASLIRVSLAGAAALAPAQLEQRTVDAYRCIRRLLAGLPHPHPVRFWNFIPDINQAVDAQRDRYMVFNAGRFTAFSGWFGSGGEFGPHLPAASAVGQGGDALVIHCLSMRQPGTAIENPRQIPAFGYSARYGPRPPCFARATIADATDAAGVEKTLLIVSGTASILGEKTVHLADLDAQLAELVRNLRALLNLARPQVGAAGSHPLAAMESARIYFPQPDDAPAIAAAARMAFGPRTALEMVQANLCRPDLLVEVEGIAPLGGAGQHRSRP